MTRLVLTVLLALGSMAGLCVAALPLNKQAELDGHYAGIHAKRMIDLQAAANMGRMTQTAAQKEIQTEAVYVNTARARWAKTPYRSDFEKAYQSEIDGTVATPGQQGGGQQGGGVGGGQQRGSPPIALSLPVKVVLFFVAVWACKRLWNAPVGKAKAVVPDYSSLKVKLSSAEKSQLAEAQQRYDRRREEIDRALAEGQTRIAALSEQSAILMVRASVLADALTASAVKELNETAPEFTALRTTMEQARPCEGAPWSDKIWMEFARAPKPETLWNVGYARLDEAGLLPGETGISAPCTVPLLAAKGPVVVQCDAASKPKARAAIQNMVLRAAISSPAEIRFSLIDPYGLGSAFPMRALLPRVRTSARTPGDELTEIVDDIRRINEAVVAQAESFAHLSNEQRAGELFEIVVALDYPRAYERDPRALDYLARVAQSGPRAGRHLILEWDGAPAPADLARFAHAELIDARNASESMHFDTVPSVDLQKTLLAAVAAVKSRSTGGDWNSQVRPAKFFAESSARIVETPVGERLRFWFGDNQDGNPCAHGMLAGQTGSGKSFLLHVLITGMAARYSPSELRLVLVDGKNGVEFEAYRNLPHAEVVCLRTSPAIARSVLADFVAEMEDRYRKFLEPNVQKLEDYRQKTGQPMPRMLMVVDEYQQLLEGDPDLGADLLNKILEKGRAAGLHLVLGSQTFDVRGLPSAAMRNVHLRAALSLPIDYIQSLAAFGPEGKKLIRDLAPSGQVVINDASGKDGANARGAVTRFDASAGCALLQVVADITAAGGMPSGSGAVVLSGNDAAVLADNPFVNRWKSSPPDAATLQATARQALRNGGFGIDSWSAADRPLPLWLGRKFDVHGHLLVPLRRAAGHNLLALGSHTGTRLCMLANGLAALRSMRSVDDVDVLLLDGLSEGQPGAGMLAVGLEELRAAGARVQMAAPDAAAAALETFSAAAMQPRNPDAFRLLILSEPEYFPDLAAPSGYGAQPAGASRILKELLRAGPQLSAHAVVTASGIGALSTVVHPSREAAFFNHRVVQQSNEEESMALFSSLAATRIAAQTGSDLAAMYVDSVQGVRVAQLFKPYAASPKVHGDQSAAGLTAALGTLYGTAHA